MRATPGPRPVFRILLAALLAATPAAGQVIGTVVDDGDGSPVVGALLIVTDAGGSELTRALTDADGAFRLRLPHAGPYFVGAHAPGYESLVGVRLEVPDRPLSLELRLAPDPIAVEPVAVVAARRRRRLEAVGYYQRERQGIGRFLSSEQIEERAIDRLSDAVRMEPSVLVRPILDGPRAGENAYAVSFRGASRQHGPCTPTLVLDGVKLGDGLLLDDIAHPANVLAVELYPRGHGAPVQWSGYDAGCGVIAVWTKRDEP